MSRTITQLHYERLIAEAEEADLIGQIKVAEHLTRQIEKTAVREDNTSYTYANESFQQDIEENIWSAIIRTADFHGVSIDSMKAQELVEFYSQNLVKSIRSIGKIATEIGSYEPPIPGEDGTASVIDLTEEE